MATSQKQRDANLREKLLQVVIAALTAYDPELEILRTGTGEIAIPVLDEEQNERYWHLTGKIPTGERGGEPYDGYAEAADFAKKQTDKAEDAKQKAIEKEKKMAKDAEVRAAKKAAKEAEQE